MKYRLVETYQGEFIIERRKNYYFNWSYVESYKNIEQADRAIKRLLDVKDKEIKRIKENKPRSMECKVNEI